MKRVNRRDIYNLMAKTPDKPWTAPELAASLETTSDSARKMCRDLEKLDLLEAGPEMIRKSRNAASWKIKGAILNLPISVRQVKKVDKSHAVKIPSSEDIPSRKRGKFTQHLTHLLHSEVAILRD